MIPAARNPAKPYLSRYRGLKCKITALQAAINEALADAANMTITIKAVNVQSSGSGERMADNVIKAVDATALLETEKAEAERTLAEIMEAIRSVDDEIQQTILIEKYVNGRTLEDIRMMINYEISNTKIIHGKALWNVWQYMKAHGIGGEEYVSEGTRQDWRHKEGVLVQTVHGLGQQNGSAPYC